MLRLAFVLAAHVVLALTFASSAVAAELTPVGRWKTIDDKTGKPKSVVRLWQEDGKIFGKIESLILEPGEEPNPKCDKCQGELKNQLVIGMTILWDLTKDGTEWSGGKILDPDNGKIYKCYIEPVDGGARLKVRGFIGFSLFGRTQYWVRAD